MKHRLLALLCLALAIGFASLGVWQVERRSWKLALIDRVERRVAADPVPLPARSDWNGDQAYRHVRVSGRFLHDRETLVQAVTVRGAGWWVVTPLVTAGTVLLVNRGFVPAERGEPDTRAKGQVRGDVTITGLLRTTEPGGGFLRSNDPAGDRWYSREVAAIAASRRIGDTPPFFLDADAAPNPGGLPIGGLTVVRFANNHLIYALTWFALAGLSLAGAWLALRDRRISGA